MQERNHYLAGYGIMPKNLVKRAAVKLGIPGAVNMYDGEYHAVLQTPEGPQMASYMGPGTAIHRRLERGDQPVSEMDKVSQAHDLRYSLAKRPREIQEADERFLKKGRVVNDSVMNKAIGLGPIAAKYAAERAFGVKYPTQRQLDANDENDSLLRSKLAELEQEGYGDPAAALKKKMARVRAGRGLKTAGGGLRSAGGGLRTAGGGLRLAGKQGGKGVAEIRDYIRTKGAPAVERAIAELYTYAKPQILAAIREYGPGAAQWLASNVVKPYLAQKFGGQGGRGKRKRQRGGFIFSLIAAGIAAISAWVASSTVATALVAGAASAIGAAGVNALIAAGQKGKGRLEQNAMDNEIRSQLMKLELSMEDFSAQEMNALETADRMLRINPATAPNAAALTSKVILHAAVRKLKQKYGATKQVAISPTVVKSFESVLVKKLQDEYSK